MTRDRLPNRRAQETFEFFHGNATYTASVGLYADGRPGEVFISAHKVGTDTDLAVKDAAVLLSLALQHGCTFDTLKTALMRDALGKPEGVVGALVDLMAEQRA